MTGSLGIGVPQRMAALYTKPYEFQPRGDFAGRLKLAVPDDCTNLKRWYAAVSARPSATA